MIFYMKRVKRPLFDIPAIICLTAHCLLFTITESLAQQTIPDGTQGEELEVMETDTLPEKWPWKEEIFGE